MSETLFGGYDPQPDPQEGLSADRRRTLRQRQEVASGIHPVTGGVIKPELGTCGDCLHRRQHFTESGKSYPKCDGPWGRVTHSAASDVRAWWPACASFSALADLDEDDRTRWECGQ